MMPRILAVFIGLMLIAAAAYIIYPRSDIWVIPIVNMAGMTYLVYCVIFHSTTAYISRLPDETGEKAETEKAGEIRVGAMSEEQMKEVCDKVMNYLTTSGAYTNPDLSLSMLAVETGISHTNLSRSMNGYLKKNFFDIINELRVEEAKKQLRLLDNNLTIDSVAEKCGFSSSRSFFRSFKKYENTTPNKWMKNN
jgi:AraC-like DNA-binding protein